jgi:hypothetical protein
VVLEARHVIEPVHAGLPSAAPQKIRHVLLAGQFGARRRSVFGRNADQIAYDADQPIAMFVNISTELLFERDILL